VTTVRPVDLARVVEIPEVLVEPVPKLGAKGFVLRRKREVHASKLTRVSGM
jgi:hypothetical protein